jgi:hypothetical protein
MKKRKSSKNWFFHDLSRTKERKTIHVNQKLPFTEISTLGNFVFLQLYQISHSFSMNNRGSTGSRFLLILTLKSFRIDMQSFRFDDRDRRFPYLSISSGLHKSGLVSPIAVNIFYYVKPVSPRTFCNRPARISKVI